MGPLLGGPPVARCGSPARARPMTDIRSTVQCGAVRCSGIERQGTDCDRMEGEHCPYRRASHRPTELLPVPRADWVRRVSLTRRDTRQTHTTNKQQRKRERERERESTIEHIGSPYSVITHAHTPITYSAVCHPPSLARFVCCTQSRTYLPPDRTDREQHKHKQTGARMDELDVTCRWSPMGLVTLVCPIR